MIKLNYASDTSKPTKIIFENKKINFSDNKYIIILNNLFNKINPNNLYFFNDKNFYMMYQSYMNKMQKNEKINPSDYYEKIKLLDRLNEEI